MGFESAVEAVQDPHCCPRHAVPQLSIMPGATVLRRRLYRSNRSYATRPPQGRYRLLSNVKGRMPCCEVRVTPLQLKLTSMLSRSSWCVAVVAVGV